MNDKKEHIVVVDDDEDLTALIKRALESRGFEVTCIHTGAAAKKYLFEESRYRDVNLLILDRILPDMDGIEILKLWGEKEHHMPCLVLSVLSSDREVLTGLRTGAVDYIGKPFNLQILVNKALSLVKQERE
ncbi:MAG: response regulator [Chlamydiia bacterium]|nr:response regulator [Chlamydiia bacterium]